MKKKFNFAHIIWRIGLIIVVLLPGPAEATVEPKYGIGEAVSMPPAWPVDVAPTVDGATTASVPDVPATDLMRAGQAPAGSAASSRTQATSATRGPLLPSCKV